MLENFNPLTNLLLFVPVERVLVSPSLANETTKFNCSEKNDSEKLKKSHFGQIQLQPEFYIDSY